MSFSTKIILIIPFLPLQINFIYGQETTSEDYEVYSRVISELFPKKLDKSENVPSMVVSTTIKDSSSMICELISSTADDLLHDRQPSTIFPNMYFWLIDTTGNVPIVDSLLIDLVCQLESSTEQKELRNHFSFELPVKMISQEKLQNIFDWESGGGWYKFRKQYPEVGGIIRLSNIVYSPDRQKGLFYLSISGGMENGAGYYLYFDLGGRDKIIKTKIILWIS